MNVIKTDWRSCLSDKSLSQLVTVKLEAASVLPHKENGELVPGFDPMPAIEHFLTVKDRRKVRDANNDAPHLPAEPKVVHDQDALEPGAPPQPVPVQAAAMTDDPDMIIEDDDECYYSDDDLKSPSEDLRREEQRAFAQFSAYMVVSGAYADAPEDDFSDSELY